MIRALINNGVQTRVFSLLQYRNQWISSSSHASSMLAAAATSVSNTQIRFMTMRERRFIKYQERKEKESRRVRSLYPQQKRKVNNTFLKQVLNSYKQHRRWKPAYQMFQNLVQHRVIPDRENFRRFLYVVGYRGGELKKAFSILRYCGRTMKDVAAYNIMIHSLAHYDFKMNDDVENYMPSSSFQKAFELYEEMKTQRNITRKLKPDIFTFHYLLKNCVAELNRIKKRQEEPEKHPHDPNVTYFTEEQVMERARFVIDEMMMTDVTFLQVDKVQSILSELSINVQEIEDKYRDRIEQEKLYDEEYRLWKRQKQLQRMIDHEQMEDRKSVV